jgi:hypothetical protein
MGSDITKFITQRSVVQYIRGLTLSGKEIVRFSPFLRVKDSGVKRNGTADLDESERSE